MKYCPMCFKDKSEKDFYEGFRECKKCTGDWLDKQSNEKAFKDVKVLLKGANYIVNEELLMAIFFGDKDEFRGTNNSSKLSEYLRKVNSLQQYQEYRYKEIQDEKTDIDFINDDIKQLKKNIEKAIQKEDFNAHNKWMNCLRDALELRERLQDGSKYTINLGIVNVNSKTANDFANELIKLVESTTKCN